MTTTTTSATPTVSVRARVQKFGTFLSNMVMPNLAAFIAWGLITALFIQTGWLQGIFHAWDNPHSWVAHIGGWDSAKDVGIVGPMITYLLPMLIGYTGGKNVYGTRGGVVGAIATFGVIAGATIPMFIGAMIMGPLAGYTMKHIDAIWDGKIKPGLEMLVDNFSAGIWAGFLAVVGFFLIDPPVTAFSNLAQHVVDFLVSHHLLPLTSIFIEPAKVLFLNNAVNHGILTPLGTEQALHHGKSILFLLEANPGPGLGLLIAYSLFGTGMAKASAPGAIVIQFIGGIHEVYFPYVLMKPKLIAATILGGMTGVAINVAFHSGLRAPAAPGSIIAVWAQTPGSSLIGVTLSVIGAATVSCLVASVLLRLDKNRDEGDLAAATASMEAMKGKSSIASSLLSDTKGGPIRKIVFACDAGMGSSAMGASVLRRKIQEAGFADVKVVNKAISALEDEWDVVVTHKDLAERAGQHTGSAVLVTVDNFMGSPRYDEVVELVKARNGAGGEAVVEEAGSAAGLLAPYSVVLGGVAHTRDDAITEAGNLLVAAGAVDASYVTSMHEREGSVSTNMGNGLAIPHGTNTAKGTIRRTALSFVRYDNPVSWAGGDDVSFVVGVAGADDDHLAVMSKLATVFVDADQVAALRSATSADDVLRVLGVVEASV